MVIDPTQEFALVELERVKWFLGATSRRRQKRRCTDVVIDPTQEFALVELERVKWFLGNLDLTKNEKAGNSIGEAYAHVSEAIKFLRRARKLERQIDQMQAIERHIDSMPEQAHHCEAGEAD